MRRMVVSVIHIPHHEEVDEGAEKQEANPDDAAARDAEDGRGNHTCPYEKQAGCDHPGVRFFIHVFHLCFLSRPSKDTFGSI